MALLEVQGIHKRFGPSHVLRGVGFTLGEGESLAIIGPSGSGKTTLLRCLNLLEHPDVGKVFLRGDLLYDAELRGLYDDQGIRLKRLHFGLVFQAFNLFPQYTALRNVVLALELQARGRPGFKDRRREVLTGIKDEGVGLLEQMGLGSKLESYPYQLSGGQQQRVAIARALALKPDVLCFDEPTSALDPELTGEVLKVIKGLAERKTTMVIVTHEMQFARSVADKVMFIDEGSVVESGTPQEVFEGTSNGRTLRFLERYGK